MLTAPFQAAADVCLRPTGTSLDTIWSCSCQPWERMSSSPPESPRSEKEKLVDEIMELQTTLTGEAIVLGKGYSAVSATVCASLVLATVSLFELILATRSDKASRSS